MFGLLSKLGGLSWLPGRSSDREAGEIGSESPVQIARKAKKQGSLAPATPPQGLQIATFAGGCFWGLQLAFDRAPGVVESTVGYTGGRALSPTYESVCSGRSGHAEAVQVYFDPDNASYESLLEIFFSRIDPTTRNRQGADRGSQYRSAVYYHSEEQRAAAQRKFDALDEELARHTIGKLMGSRVVTELEAAGDYYVAEKYHQKYLQRGGRSGAAQSSEKGCTDKIRCYG